MTLIMVVFFYNHYPSLSSDIYIYVCVYMYMYDMLTFDTLIMYIWP